MHMDAEGYVGVPEVAHTIGHDDEGTRDISPFDLTSNAAKIPLALFSFPFLLFVVPASRTFAHADIVYRVLSGLYTRWRPPLRAPPLPA
jgi:hypothetical protein